MKNTTTLKGFALLFALWFGAMDKTNAQNPLIYNDGAIFYINGNIGDSAIVWVDGGVTNNANLIVNRGNFFIKGDFVNNAQVGDVDPLLRNKGVFEVTGDWINNGNFEAAESTVKFVETGDIIGTSITTFNNVELAGSIVRTQVNTNALISESGTLDLGSGEWATEENVLTVLRTATGAIIRETNCDPCGFVSSLGDGHLARSTDQNAGYLFPVGSSINDVADPTNFERYRPVIITPETSAADMFAIRFVNESANNTGLAVLNVDPTICYVNPWWYHRINHLGGANATASIALHSNPDNSDENYNTIANWGAINNRWENMDNATVSTSGVWNRVSRNDWDDFQTGIEDAYIMGFRVPSEPEPDGLDALCADVEETYTYPENGSTYDFVVTGGTIVSQTGNSLTIIWDNATLQSALGTIVTIETVPNNINGGCASLLGTQNVEIFSLPIADFTVDYKDTNLPATVFIYDILEMLDVSVNTEEWAWDFGDGSTSTNPLPFHAYDALGTYDVELLATSDLGCQSTLVVEVNVVEGLVIPNVFTPNGDGWNDVFDIRTSDIGAFDIEIYNRWGNMVYENTSAQISWNGTNMAGSAVPAGTYFYVINKAELNSGNPIEKNDTNFNFAGKDWTNGWLTLIR